LNSKPQAVLGAKKVTEFLRDEALFPRLNKEGKLEPQNACYRIRESKMDESRLDQDLKTLSKRPRPDLPVGFNAMVWSKVRSREILSRVRRESWFKTLLSAFATPQWAAAALGLVLTAGWTLGRITAGLVASPTETRLTGSVTGEVIDLACYFDDGGSGPDHAECARMCIASGLPVGLKAKDGTIYVLIGKQAPPSAQPGAKHESLNAQLAPYAAKIVTISGTIVSKKGANVIENAQLLREEALRQQSPDDLKIQKPILFIFAKSSLRAR
jgi:hypothetical protein